jgi:uncharacterized protein YjdB
MTHDDLAFRRPAARPRSFLGLVAALILPIALTGAGCGRDALDRLASVQLPDGASDGAPRGDGATIDGARDAGTSDASGAADAPDAGGTSDAPGGDAADAAQATLVSIAIQPAMATLIRGSSLALIVTGIYSDGTTGEITARATFASDDPMAAGVSAAGVVTARARGTATITARVGALSAQSVITVSAATVVQITVLPATATTAAGTTVPFTADGTLSDGTHQDLTGSATWRSSDTGVATVAATGVATALAPGTATITATFGRVSGTAQLTVSGATLTSLEIDPVDPTVAIGADIAFTATGIYSDGTRADLTATVTWTSSAPRVVTIDATGHATARAAGRAVITAATGAMANARTATSTVTVTNATLRRIAVSPAAATLMVGGTAVLTATGTYSDGTTADLTGMVTWTAAPAAVATVSNAAGTAGTVTAVGVGTATVTATLGAISGTATITVSPARLVAIIVSPAAASVPAGASVGLAAQGIFSDASTRDITGQVAWSSSDDTIATVSNQAGTNGQVTGVAAGMATITAALDGVSGTAVITVEAATLRSIAVTPANATTTVGLRSSYSAVGTYSNGTTTDLTTQVTWSTGDATIAAETNVAGAAGQLLARAVGTTTVVATLGGVSGSTMVTVIARAATTLSIAPIASSTRLGTNVPFTATEILSNGTQQNVTGQVTWTSSTPAVATIGRGGVARPVAVGTTTITATLTVMGMTLTASTTLTVTSSVVTSVQVTPVAPIVAVGTVVPFTAEAIFSDGTSQDVTANATWVSSAPGVVGVTTAGPARGRGTAVAAGTAVVTATFMGLSGSTTVTVSDAVIVQIVVSPAGLSLAVGSRQQATAQAVFSDGSSMDVTARATWVSTAPMVAGVSDAAATRGLITAVAPGMATIQASLSGLTGSAAVVVSDATLTAIQVTPFNPILPVGFARQMTATALFSDGTNRDVTAIATWTTGDAKVAAVSDAAGSKGLLTAVAGGTTAVIAQLAGTSGMTGVTVSPAQLVSIAIAPSAPSLAVGQSLPLAATGTFDDGTTLDVTVFVTWTSSDTTIADVSNADGSRGQVTGFAAGSATIQARRGAVMATAALTVH